MELGRRTINKIGQTSDALVIPARYRRESLGRADDIIVGFAGGLLVAGPVAAERRIAELLVSLEASHAGTSGAT